MIESSSLSLYADDSKVYKCISNEEDCNRLQHYLYNVEKWCETWHLKLNYNKCMVISFTNKKKPIIYNYDVNGTTLSRVETVKDLGVHLTPNLNYATHINFIILKAFKMFGFLKRTSSEFSNIKTLKSLFVTLVRSQLEYACQVWSPHQRYLIERLERVQCKFIKYLCWKSNIDYSTSNYNNLCSFFKLPRLEYRRQFLDATFFFKCMLSYHDCPDILYGIRFSVPSRSLRSKPDFKPISSKVNVHSSAFLQRTMKFFNEILPKHEFDIYNCSYTSFRNLLYRNVFST